MPCFRSLALLALLATPLAQAQPAPPPQGASAAQGHRGPPAEALQACKSLKAGAACSFTPPGRAAMKGQCWAPPERPLACRPADAPAPPAR